MMNEQSSSVTIGTSPVLVSEQKSISSNAKRVRLICTNTSTAGQTVTLAVNAEPVSLAGIVLYPGGSQAWEKQSTDIQQGRVLGIADAAGATCATYEEVEQ